MSYKVVILPHFRRQFKLHIRKYRHLKKSVIEALENFNKNSHASLGNNLYKVRIKSDDLRKGKSKSFRLIILLIEKDGFLIPIMIYFKGDRDNIAKKELNEHLELILFELHRS
ncbi:type II toxin-antitoxin system RelE/ParE family toxin [Patescibacteria group bacterium]